MATVATPLFEATRRDLLLGTPRANFVDRWIYVFTAVFFVAINLAGFIPDSLDKIAAVNAGTRPSFPLVMHVHAVLMASYLTLLVAQTWLAATGRLRWHMQLGVLAAAIVPILVVVGFMLVRTVYQQTWTAAQQAPPGLRDTLEAVLMRKENVLLIQLRIGLLFPLFVAIGVLARRSEPGLHKRMAILATVVLLPPAIDRILWLPSSFPQSFVTSEIYMLVAIAPMFIWDTLRNGYVHRAYLIWFGFTLPFAVTLHGLWNTPFWHATAHQFLAR